VGWAIRQAFAICENFRICALKLQGNIGVVMKIRYLIGACALAVVVTLNYFHQRGLCISEWRFITQDDVLYGAMYSKVFGQSKRPSEMTLEEKQTLKKFIVANTKNIHVFTAEQRHGNADFLERFFGYFSGAVEYNDEKIEILGVEKYVHYAIYPVDSCGMRHLETYGSRRLVK
jgi:hypothetical protein